MIARRPVTALCFFLTVLAFIILQSPSIANAQGVISYCASDTGQAVVYFSNSFDTKLPLHLAVETRPIATEFNEYLIGRFDFKGNEYYPAGCPSFRTVTEAEAGKRDLENQMRQANKKIVEVDWSYTPNPAEIARHSMNRTEHDANVPPGPPPTHTFCISDSYQGTFYSTGPFDAGGNSTYAQWYSGFNRLLTQKYSFRGQARCYVTTLEDARRLMSARTEGARASGRRVVDTGWKYDPATAAVAKPTPRDEDPEPTPKRPAAPSATQTTHDAAVKEMPESVAYCRKDPLMSVVFNCDWFARSVHNYRVEHPTDTETVASLVASGKLNASDSIDSTHVTLWVRDRATAQQLSNRVTNCITQNVIVTLYRKPQANQLPIFYKDAVATCSKSP